MESREPITGELRDAMGNESKRSLIGDCCRGKRPTAYGYEWRYAE